MRHPRVEAVCVPEARAQPPASRSAPGRRAGIEGLRAPFGEAARALARLALASVVAASGACQGSTGTDAPPLSQGGPQGAAGVAALGANLPVVNDWMHTPVYVDLVHQARRFGSPSAPWDERATLGDDGWPIGDFGVVLSTGLGGYAGSAGTYKLSFTGRAKIGTVASDAQIVNQAYDPASDTTRAEVTVAPTAGQLFLSFTQTGPGIRNLKLIRPGYDAADPPLFTSEFLRHIQRFGTLRFMDWLRTNGTEVTTWSSRATPATTHYASSAGVPWEHVIALANATGKDLWINIPIGADDDYVLQLARLFKATLNPAAIVYVEYSNEIWNASFPQYDTNLQQAVAAVRADAKSPLVHDGATDRNLIALRHVGERLKRISEIFRGVHGDAAMMTTVRPVLGGQVAQPYVSEAILSYVAAVHGPPSRYFYGLAGAPYFNLGSRQTADGLSTDQVLQAMDTSIQELPRANYLETNVAQASWYRLRFLGYEGGPDTFGAGSIASKKAAGLDPRMRSLCTRYLSTWYANGGGLMMWFTAGAGNWDTQYGTWELTTDLAIDDTPKIRCIDDALSAPLPPVQARNVVPGTFDALAFVGNLPPYSARSAARVRYLHPGSHVDYLVFAPRGGTYSLGIRAAARTAGNTVDVLVDGELAASRFEFAHAGWENPVGNAAIALRLRAGFNTIRIVTRDEAPVDGGYSLTSLTVR